MTLSVQKIRYPPFEPDQMEPSGVPIIEVAIEHDGDSPTQFAIGNTEDWHVEWRDYKEEDSNLRVYPSNVYRKTPDFINKSRLGWYIDPDPLHNVSRRLIYPTVIILICTLFIHAIEPVLVETGIITKAIAGAYRIGPLEYPKLLFISFPIFLMPLLFRTWANFRDFTKQKVFLRTPIDSVEMNSEINRGCVIISNVSLPTDIIPIKIRCQVGVAIPKRSAVDNALGRLERMQPPPGMSTKLPEKRVATTDETGTGVGEVAPMQASESKMLMLEPMRIMESGEWKDVPTGNAQSVINMQIPLPLNEWPGTVYSDLIAIHWELVIQCKFGSMDCKWVQPIIMEESNEPITIGKAPVKSGRVELSN